MHIIIGLITAAAGLIWAINSLQQSGFRLSSLNPFYWLRRTRWKKQYQELPLYQLDSSLEVAAVLIVSVAKLEGEISREQKQEILTLFKTEFNLDDNASSDLFASTCYLLQSEHNFLNNIDKIVSPVIQKFSEEQAVSTVELIIRIANLDSAMSADQSRMISTVKQLLNPVINQQQKW